MNEMYSQGLALDLYGFLHSSSKRVEGNLKEGVIFQLTDSLGEVTLTNRKLLPANTLNSL